MRAKKLILFLLISCLALSLNAQDCDCKSNFEWTKKTFEENDAGFCHSLNMKGKDAYEIHNQLYREKVKNITDPLECTQTLYQWLIFFRKGHIGISRLTVAPSNTSSEAKPEVSKDIQQVDVDQFKKYLDGKKKTDYEGIWNLGAYIITIRAEGDKWVGRVLKTPIKGWEIGEKKMEIVVDKQNNARGMFVMADRSIKNLERVEMLNKNYMQLSNLMTIKRDYPNIEEPEDKGIKEYFALSKAPKPVFKRLDENTLLLRIPSFDGSQKRMIDSLINVNKEMILSTPNLIIDLRGNGGGGDQSFYQLLPLIYTNPIRNIPVEFLSTKLNNQKFFDYATNPKYKTMVSESQKKQYMDYYDELEKHRGDFVALFGDSVNFIRIDKVYDFPKNIGVIVDNGCASTTEQFLLAAKQSKKVKLFGITTMGALDISNMHGAKSPCGDFELRYCTSRSLRIPGMMIDDVGLQPDYYIDKSIPEYKWIDYVKKTLNAK